MKSINAEVTTTNGHTFGLKELRVGHIYRNTTTREIHLVVETLTHDESVLCDNVREKRLVRVSDFREVTTHEDHRYTWVGELHIGEEL